MMVYARPVPSLTTTQLTLLASKAKAKPRAEPSSNPSSKDWERKRCLLLGLVLTALQRIYPCQDRIIKIFTEEKRSNTRTRGLPVADMSSVCLNLPHLVIIISTTLSSFTMISIVIVTDLPDHLYSTVKCSVEGGGGPAVLQPYLLVDLLEEDVWS